MTTLHGRLDLPDLVPLYRHFSDAPLVSISDNQRKPLPFANWLRHRAPRPAARACTPSTPSRAATTSPSSAASRPKSASTARSRSRSPAACRCASRPRSTTADRDYFASRIRPLLDHPLVEFIGEIDEPAKNDFIGNARALLFPIDWPEPFGLVMIEAFACGTPVIAIRAARWPR